nr:hypothetical protein Q903MT_gene3554 [Picea sitchensis]
MGGWGPYLTPKSSVRSSPYAPHLSPPMRASNKENPSTLITFIEHLLPGWKRVFESIPPWGIF